MKYRGFDVDREGPHRFAIYATTHGTVVDLGHAPDLAGAKKRVDKIIREVQPMLEDARKHRKKRRSR